MNKKKKIMLIPPIGLPIPAVGGGAVEQLITQLLDINEIEGRVNFVIVSKNDKQAAQYRYKNSKIYYYHPDIHQFKELPLVKIFWNGYRIWLKLFRNRITVRFSQKKDVRMDEYLFQLYRIARREKVDYIVIEGGWNLSKYGVFSELLGKERVFLHLHASSVEDLHVRNAVNNSLSISKFVRNLWVKHKSIPGINVVLYNGIDISQFQNSISSETRDIKRKQLGVSDEECLVLYCGRIIPEKGIKELLEAFDLIRDEKIKLLLIGNVDFSVNSVTEFSATIKEMVRNNPNVIMLGYIPNNQLPEYYAMSDIQVVPSICQEGAGLVAVEGMAAGLPLIVTQSGGMVEYVNSDTAIQVPIDSQLPQNLASCIKLLANDKARRNKMGNAGKQRVKQFDREYYYKNFVDIFENLQRD